MKAYRITARLFALPLCLMLCGCKNLTVGRNELSQLVFPNVSAVDKGSEGVTITLASEKDSQGDIGGKSSGEGGTSAQQNENIIQATGKTIMEANRSVAAFSNKDLHWGQNEYIIVGEEAARQNLSKYLEFLIRDHENRLTVAVIIAKGVSGSEIVYAMNGSKGGVAAKLEELFENKGELSLAEKTDLRTLFNTLDSKNTASVIPAVSLTDKPGQNTESAGGQSAQNEKLLEMKGFAVIKDEQMLGYVENNMALAYSIIKNSVSSSLIVIEDMTGNEVSLEIINTRAENSVTFTDGLPSIKIKVTVEFNIGEMTGKADIFDKKNTDYLEQQMNAAITDALEQVIAYGQDNNADFFGFSEMIFRKHPVKYEKIKDRWQEIFPDMQFSVEVKSVANRSYNIKTPLRNWEAEKQ